MRQRDSERAEGRKGGEMVGSVRDDSMREAGNGVGLVVAALVAVSHKKDPGGRRWGPCPRKGARVVVEVDGPTET